MIEDWKSYHLEHIYKKVRIITKKCKQIITDLRQEVKCDPAGMRAARVTTGKMRGKARASPGRRLVNCGQSYAEVWLYKVATPTLPYFIF